MGFYSCCFSRLRVGLWRLDLMDYCSVVRIVNASDQPFFSFVSIHLPAFLSCSMVFGSSAWVRNLTVSFSGLVAFDIHTPVLTFYYHSDSLLSPALSTYHPTPYPSNSSPPHLPPPHADPAFTTTFSSPPSPSPFFPFFPFSLSSSLLRPLFPLPFNASNAFFSLDTGFADAFAETGAGSFDFIAFSPLCCASSATRFGPASCSRFASSTLRHPR